MTHLRVKGTSGTTHSRLTPSILTTPDNNQYNPKCYGKYYAKPVYDKNFVETDEIADFIQTQATLKRSDIKASLDELGAVPAGDRAYRGIRLNYDMLMSVMPDLKANYDFMFYRDEDCVNYKLDI